MEPFTKLSAIAAPFDEPNVDTNQLCPTRFNKVTRSARHADILFHDRRFNADGTQKDFVLNREPYNKARILVADRNFGGGSARETAVWALYEFGLRSVVASSFGDVFSKICYKEGVLPVTLSQQAVVGIRKQLHENIGAKLTIDLLAQELIDVTGRAHSFDILPIYKKCLLEGLDDIGRIQQYRAQLDTFEMSYRKQRPWLYSKRP